MTISGVTDDGLNEDINRLPVRLEAGGRDDHLFVLRAALEDGRLWLAVEEHSPGRIDRTIRKRGAVWTKLRTPIEPSQGLVRTHLRSGVQDEYWFIAGVASKDVEAIQAELDDASVCRVDIAPSEDLPVGVFLAVAPPGRWLRGIAGNG